MARKKPALVKITCLLIITQLPNPMHPNMMRPNQLLPMMMLPLVILLLTTTLAFGLTDADEDCKGWAELGECDENPTWMLKNCAKSCDEFSETAAREAKEVEHITSFFDLEAEDIDGNLIEFENFRGKVIVIANVASYCGHTEAGYRGLNKLWDTVKDTGAVEILAFPCNQFGKQEPEELSTIKRFAFEKKGVEFKMMSKIDVNGSSASRVYKYLKKVAGPASITWNFATYFVVSPDGEVHSFSGTPDPLELGVVIDGLIEREL